jgi:hypothetical protein
MSRLLDVAPSAEPRLNKNRLSMTALKLDGRILFLSEDPALIAAQLGDRDLTPAEAGRLHGEISTSEITPLPSLAYFDQRPADHAYTGVKADEVLPLGVRAVRAGGFAVTVAGARYGKGSSREHSRWRRRWLASASSSRKALSGSIARTPITSASSPPPALA